MKNKGFFIPLGMIFGSAIAIVLSMFFDPNALGFSIIIGGGIGLLFGSIVYGLYSQKEEN